MGEASRKKISVGKIEDSFYRLCWCSGMTVRETIDQQSAVGFYTFMPIPFTFKESEEIEAIGAEILAWHLVTAHGLVFFAYSFGIRITKKACKAFLCFAILLLMSWITPCWFLNKGFPLARQRSRPAAIASGTWPFPFPGEKGSLFICAIDGCTVVVCI